MDNFDLKKYLAENRLFEKKAPVWTIEGWDDSPTIETADEGYKEAVINRIKSAHPNISDEDLENAMEVVEETWYNKGRENAKSGEGENFDVSVEEFADMAIEHYEDVTGELAEGRLGENRPHPTDVFSDEQLDYVTNMLIAMYEKLGLEKSPGETDIVKADALMDAIEGFFETLD